MEHSAQHSDVMDSLRDIQRTQSLLLDAVNTLPAKTAPGSSEPFQTAIPDPSAPILSGDHGHEYGDKLETTRIEGSDGADVKGAAGSSSALSSTPSGIRPAFTSRIILTCVVSSCWRQERLFTLV